MPISGIFCRRVCTIMSASSRVSPELEKHQHRVGRADHAEIAVARPAGWTNWAGVPVEAKVAAILVAMWPLLPMPLTITRPLYAEQRLDRRRESAVQRRAQRSQRRRLMARTRRATARSVALSAGAVMARGDSNGNRPPDSPRRGPSMRRGPCGVSYARRW